MDTPLTFTAWAAIGAVSLAPVGALFGAVAGAVARAGGHAPGGALGRSLVDALSRAMRKDFAPTTAGAIGGAVDGALFLGVIGLIVGLIAGYGGAAPDHRILVVVVIGSAMLALAAVAFGLLAHGLQRGGSAGLIFFAATGIGGVLGLSLAGALGAGCGLFGGALLGGIGAALHGSDARPPHLDEKHAEGESLDPGAPGA